MNTRGPGAVFGKIALFDGGAYMADVVAATYGRLLVIERAAMAGLMARAGPFARGVIAGLCVMLRHTMGQQEALLFQDLATRLAMTLLHEARAERPRQVDRTQAELGGGRGHRARL